MLNKQSFHFFTKNLVDLYQVTDIFTIFIFAYVATPAIEKQS